MLVIRKGKKNDGKALAELIMIVVRQMNLPLVSEIGEEKLAKMFEESIIDPAYRYSSNRALIAEINGKVVGAAFGYHAGDEDIIDASFQKQLEKNGLGDKVLFTDSEAQEGEWYLDTLAVFHDYRGQGIGSELLKNLPQFVKNSGVEFIGLNVDFDNPKAEKLYEQIGFKTTGIMTISGHLYKHMQWRF
jgi:ribosomal protein S18 acetylase RimI-like enzyme